MPRVGELFADVLIDAGVEYVFGLPGGGTLPIWDGLVDKKGEINTILARHEGGASCMADICGRLTGKPAVLMGQGLWIGTNGGFGIVESFLAGVPMVVLCDVSDYSNLSQFGPYQNSTGDYGAVDLPNMLKGMTKFTTYAGNASELIHGTQLAIKHAVTGRPGPACVHFRMAAAGPALDQEDIRPKLYPMDGYLRTSAPCISQEDAGTIADMLIQAENPVMVAGAGIHRSGAYEGVQAIAELIGMPVATSYMGKSAIRETHDLSVGTMGVIGQKIANDVIMGADVILAVGTCLAPDNSKMLSSRFINPEKQKIIQIDIESLNTGWAFPVALGVVSDAQIALREIIDCVNSRPVSIDVQKRIDDLKQSKADAAFFSDPAFISDEVPIAPERVVRELNDLVGADDQVVLDAGNNRMWMAHHFKTKKAGQIVAAGGAAGVGYGPAATLGAQMVLPGRRVVGVIGDGGMMMHLYTMEMAREYGLPVTLVVLNNACLGNVMDSQAPDRRIATSYDSPNFARIAEGIGIEGIRVEDPAEIRDALTRGLESDQPVLVDVAIADYPHFKMRT